MKCNEPYKVNLKSPVFRDGMFFEWVPVPCGKCTPCVLRKAEQMAFRLYWEDRRSVTAYFLTLTYERTPITPKGYQTLVPSDLTNYWKRVRRLQDRKVATSYRNAPIEQPIRYFACGEYGDRRGRPHYHAIVFNAYEDALIRAWQNYEPGEIKTEDGINGFAYVGTVTPGSIRYVTGYLNKQNNTNPYGPYAHWWDGKRAFSRSSLHLGSNYLSDQIIKYHRDDKDRNYVKMPGFRHKIAMPKYYRDQIWNEDERRDLYAHIARSVKEQEEIDKAQFEALSLSYSWEQRKEHVRRASDNRFGTRKRMQD